MSPVYENEIVLSSGHDGQRGAHFYPDCGGDKLYKEYKNSNAVLSCSYCSRTVHRSKSIDFNLTKNAISIIL